MNSLPKPPKLPGGRRHDEVFNPKKLFVGGLSKDTTQQQFREYWEKWGQLEDCVVMIDPNTQKNRGFGFVVFTSQSIVCVVYNHCKLASCNILYPSIIPYQGIRYFESRGSVNNEWEKVRH